MNENKNYFNFKSEDYLDVTELPVIDNSIKQYNFFEYTPTNPSSINGTDVIKIVIQDRNVITLPCQSYLHFEGQLVKTDNTDYNANADIALVNNAMMYLFSQVSYSLNNSAIESLNNPGVTTTMKNLLKYSNNLSKALNMCWEPDTSTHASKTKYTIAEHNVTGDNNEYNKGFAARNKYILSSTPPGRFAFDIPLSHIFGFCEGFDKILTGVTQSLTMTRNGFNNAIYRTDAAGAGRVILNTVSWYIPHVVLSTKAELELTEKIAAKIPQVVAFMNHQDDTITIPQGTSFSWIISARVATESPRWIIIGIQSPNRYPGGQTNNPAIFNHCNVISAEVFLNHQKYPLTDINSNFAENLYSRWYGMVEYFKTEYYGTNDTITSTQITPVTFKSLYPLFIFDCRKQDDNLRSNNVDVTVKMRFGEAVPANTSAYALVLSDKIIKIESDGTRYSTVIS